MTMTGVVRPARSNNGTAQPDERVRAESALAMRVAGQPYAEIAEQLGWRDESGARHAVSRLLDRRESESVAEYRKIETARLESLMSAYLPAALTGDVDAARLALMTHDRIAKLHGLDKQIDVVTTPVSVADVIAQARARLTALIDAQHEQPQALTAGAGE